MNARAVYAYCFFDAFKQERRGNLEIGRLGQRKISITAKRRFTIDVVAGSKPDRNIFRAYGAEKIRLRASAVGKSVARTLNIINYPAI